MVAARKTPTSATVAMPIGRPTRSTAAISRQVIGAGAGTRGRPRRAIAARVARLAVATRSEAMPAPAGPKAGSGPGPVISSQLAAALSGSMARVTLRNTCGRSAAVSTVR